MLRSNFGDLTLRIGDKTGSFKLPTPSASTYRLTLTAANGEQSKPVSVDIYPDFIIG